MPAEQVLYYYEQAKEHGGIFKIKYEGGINPKFWDETMPKPEDAAEDNVRWEMKEPPESVTEEETETGEDGHGFHGFLQKRGQERIKSVIYVKIVECGDQEEILMCVLMEKITVRWRNYRTRSMRLQRNLVRMSPCGGN